MTQTGARSVTSPRAARRIKSLYKPSSGLRQSLPDFLVKEVNEFKIVLGIAEGESNDAL